MPKKSREDLGMNEQGDMMASCGGILRYLFVLVDVKENNIHMLGWWEGSATPNKHLYTI